jgi:hypothetical protein
MKSPSGLHRSSFGLSHFAPWAATRYFLALTEPLIFFRVVSPVFSTGMP